MIPSALTALVQSLNAAGHQFQQRGAGQELLGLRDDAHPEEGGKVRVWGFYIFVAEEKRMGASNTIIIHV